MPTSNEYNSLHSFFDPGRKHLSTSTPEKAPFFLGAKSRFSISGLWESLSKRPFSSLPFFRNKKYIPTATACTSPRKRLSISAPLELLPLGHLIRQEASACTYSASPEPLPPPPLRHSDQSGEPYPASLEETTTSPTTTFRKNSVEGYQKLVVLPPSGNDVQRHHEFSYLEENNRLHKRRHSLSDWNCGSSFKRVFYRSDYNQPVDWIYFQGTCRVPKRSNSVAGRQEFFKEQR